MSPGAAAWRRPCAGAKSNSNALRKITQDAKPCRKLITGAISDGPELKRIQPRRRGHRMGGQRHRYLFSSSGCRGDPRDDGSCPGPTATGDPRRSPPPPRPLRPPFATPDIKSKETIRTCLNQTGAKVSFDCTCVFFQREASLGEADSALARLRTCSILYWASHAWLWWTDRTDGAGMMEV